MNKQTLSKILIVFTIFVTILSVKCYSLGKSLNLLQNRNYRHQRLYENFTKENFTLQKVESKYRNFKRNVVDLICQNKSQLTDEQKTTIENDLTKRKNNFVNNLNTKDKTSELYIDPATHQKGKEFLNSIFNENIIKSDSRLDWCRTQYSEMNSQIEGFITFDKNGNPITPSGGEIRLTRDDPTAFNILRIDDEGRVYDSNRTFIGTLRSDGKLISPNGDVIGSRNPDGVIIGLNGSIIGHAGAIGSTLTLNGSIIKLDGSVVNPDGSITLTSGIIIRPGGTVIGQNGQVIGTLRKDGTILRSDGVIVRLDGTIVGRPGPNDKIIGPDGKVVSIKPYIDSSLQDLINRIFPTTENFIETTLGTRPVGGSITGPNGEILKPPAATAQPVSITARPPGGVAQRPPGAVVVNGKILPATSQPGVSSTGVNTGTGATGRSVSGVKTNLLCPAIDINSETVSIANLMPEFEYMKDQVKDLIHVSQQYEKAYMK